MTPPVALVPVNRLDQAKGRLAEVLTPPQRAELALATFRTALAAAQDAGFDVTVLTADDAVAATLPAAVRHIPDQGGLAGLNAQLEAAIPALAADELLILHADLPMATGRALRALLSVAFAAPSVTVVESADGGTNAMLLRPPGRFPLAYGPASARIHRTRAHHEGLTPLTFGEPSLMLDLDSPADLQRLLEDPEGRITPAGQLLLEWHVDERLAT